MLRKAMISMLLLSMLACKEEPSPPADEIEVAAALAEYTLHVDFEGLIAFADRVVGGSPVLWALLPDADYVLNLNTITTNDLPPCVFEDRLTITQLRRRFPPHRAALRFQGAQVTLNGVRIDGLVPVVSIAGQDLRFDTGKTRPTISHAKLATKEEVERAHGQRVETLDNVGSAFVTEGLIDPMRVPFLSARVLIDFGDELEAQAIACGSPPIPIAYGFQLPGETTCTRRNPIELAESVGVIQRRLTQPIKITLHPAGGELIFQPITPGADVTIQVLNVLPMHLIDPPPDCESMGHLEVYRWFYRLLAAPENCRTRHFFPCINFGDFGGNKCPEKGFSG